MRGLFLFIYRNHVIFLFLLLEVLSFVLIVQNNRYQNSGFFNSSNKIVGEIYSATSEITDYLDLKKINKDLNAQNADLMNKLSSNLMYYSTKIDTLTDTIAQTKYINIQAKIINNSIIKRNNYITLDQGSLAGIEPDMAVIGPNGVVGIVKAVSPHFSTVISLLNKNSSISVKLKKNNYFGFVIWEGGDYTTATLTDMPVHAGIEIGDTLITSGQSVVFSEGVPVAKVKEFEIKPGDNFYTAKVELFTNFGNISYVYVLKNLYKAEQIELETKTKENDN